MPVGVVDDILDRLQQDSLGEVCAWNVEIRVVRMLPDVNGTRRVCDCHAGVDNAHAPGRGCCLDGAVLEETLCEGGEAGIAC